MSINSKIEWTETTWNPITGCTKISDGCKHCYAAVLAHRLHAMHNPRYNNEFKVTIHEDLIKKPMDWKKPQMIFVNSMSDLFHEEVPDDIIIKIFDTMNSCPQHTFQILTKRPERLDKLNEKLNWTHNIWMGVTIESTKYLYRANFLRKTSAYIKFISAEPLLEDISSINLENINWLIVRGESGPGCRPIKKEWVESLQKIAKNNGTAFFFKQWGGVNKKMTGKLLNGEIVQEYPIGLSPYHKRCPDIKN